MADYNFTLNENDLTGLLSGKDGLKQLIETVLNQVLQAQMSEHLKAEPYEHVEERTGHRNGHRPRQLQTRVGRLTLRVPQTRDGSFSTEIFKRYQRSEQAFVLGLMEMYVQGVSTRKVAKITEELCGVTFSKSTVSQLSTELQARLDAWRARSLTEARYPFVIVDAIVIKVRRDSAVRSTGILVAYGVSEEGIREPLDFLQADSENASSWEELFSRLKQRGLAGVELIVSDQHSGLVQSIGKCFQGVSWQRCQTHFMRNILGRAPRHLKGAIASELKLIFQAENKETARKLANDLLESYAEKASSAMDCFEKGLEDALAIMQFPEKYRKRLRTTNLAERVNEEIRRRERVIRIFPNEQAAERLIGAVLVDIYDNWQQSMKYFDMTEFLAWKKEKKSGENNIVCINQ